VNFIFFLEYCKFSDFGRQNDALGRQSNLVLKSRQYRPNGGKVAAMFLVQNFTLIDAAMNRGR